MHYTDIENFQYEDEAVINWRSRRGRAQIKCPMCSKFFDLPSDITIDKDGYCSTSVYHFCDDLFEGEENTEGYTVLAHLVGWGVK